MGLIIKCMNAIKLLLKTRKIVLSKNNNDASFTKNDLYSLARSKFSLIKEIIIKKDITTSELIFNCDDYKEQLPVIMNFIKKIKIEEIEFDKRKIHIIGDIPNKYKKEDILHAIWIIDKIKDSFCHNKSFDSITKNNIEIDNCIESAKRDGESKKFYFKLKCVIPIKALQNFCNHFFNVEITDFYFSNENLPPIYSNKYYYKDYKNNSIYGEDAYSKNLQHKFIEWLIVFYTKMERWPYFSELESDLLQDLFIKFKKGEIYLTKEQLEKISYLDTSIINNYNDHQLYHNKIKHKYLNNETNSNMHNILNEDKNYYNIEKYSNLIYNDQYKFNNIENETHDLILKKYASKLPYAVKAYTLDDTYSCSMQSLLFFIDIANMFEKGDGSISDLNKNKLLLSSLFNFGMETIVKHDQIILSTINEHSISYKNFEYQRYTTQNQEAKNIETSFKRSKKEYKTLLQGFATLTECYEKTTMDCDKLLERCDVIGTNLVNGIDEMLNLQIKKESQEFFKSIRNAFSHGNIIISPEDPNMILLYDEVEEYNEEKNTLISRRTFDCKTTINDILNYIISLITIGEQGQKIDKEAEEKLKRVILDNNIGGRILEYDEIKKDLDNVRSLINVKTK